ncbi:MAG: alpha/beta fold hydrolase [Solirubrobacterales bacterium]|nr:alpha/beta fold hydrolase [Solirubrobacterales bacterium]
MSPERADASPDRFVHVEGVRLRVRVAGEGQPLLLIMGVGGNIEMWHPFDRDLHARGVQTIGFDAPGTGESGELDRPRRMPWLARMVERLLDELGHERVDVLGTSWGGALAQQLAHQCPGRVRRLVLAATAAGMPGFGGVPGHPSALFALLSPRRYRDPDYLASIAGRLYGGGASSLPEEHLAARSGRPPSSRGYRHQIWAAQAWSALPWLRSLEPPTLILAGDDDPLVPVANGHILARLIPDARLVVVRGGGHLFLLQRAPDMADLIADFLAA